MEKWFYLFDKWIMYRRFIWTNKTKKELWKNFVDEIKKVYNIKTNKIDWSKLDYNEVGKVLCEYYIDDEGKQHDGYFVLDNNTGLWKEKK